VSRFYSEDPVTAITFSATVSLGYWINGQFVFEALRKGLVLELECSYSRDTDQFLKDELASVEFEQSPSKCRGCSKVTRTKIVYRHEDGKLKIG
jgi:hypothetical protein